MTELLGRTLLNRYRVDEFIGHGGMADVYKVYDSKRAVTLAIKVLRPDLAGDASLFRRFSQEAELLEALNHPHIVRLYEWHRADDLVFIVMDYVDGSNLREVIKDRGRPFSAAEIVQYLQPVCTALHFAHQKSVFHCDIKPSNILIGRDGRVYVSDFGVARIARGAGSLGTPTHMAPEQFEGGTVDARTDIYALGVMLYELATGGNRPFKGDSQGSSGSTLEERMEWEHLHRPPPPPRQYNASISPALEAVILRALEKRPRDRFASTLEMLEALEGASARVPTSGTAEIPTSVSPVVKTPVKVTPPVPPPRPQPPPPKRQPAPPQKAGPPVVHGVKAYILVRVGNWAGQWFPVNSDAWLIGRSREAQLHFSSSRVSRRHAMIRKGKGYYYIEDLGSTLGTYVNGQRVTVPRAIRSGDVIRLGDVELEFRETK
jgi:serine/threonine-protein kinase